MRMPRFGLLQPSWGTPVIQVPTIPTFASQALPAPGVLYQSGLSRLSSHKRKLILCGCRALSSRKAGAASVPFTLSRSWAEWQLLKSCQAEKQNLLPLLVSFQAIWLFIKGLFRLRKITETRRLAKFEDIRVAHCSTLDSYWITNKGKEPDGLIFWHFCHRIHTLVPLLPMFH